MAGCILPSISWFYWKQWCFMDKTFVKESMFRFESLDDVSFLCYVVIRTKKILWCSFTTFCIFTIAYEFLFEQHMLLSGCNSLFSYRWKCILVGWKKILSWTLTIGFDVTVKLKRASELMFMCYLVRRKFTEISIPFRIPNEIICCKELCNSCFVQSFNLF